MKIYEASFVLTVIGNLIYHVSQKSIPKTVNPFFVYMIIYSIALLGCVIGSLFYSSGGSMAQTLRSTNWAVIAAGIAVFSIEIGFLLAYRAGWNLSSAAMACSVAVTILLVPIGVLLFRERLSTSRILGTILCFLGLYLVAKQ